MSSEPPPFVPAVEPVEGGRLLLARDLAAGVVVLALGLLQVRYSVAASGVYSILIAVWMGIAIALFRIAPSVALLSVWVADLVQVGTDSTVLVTQLAVIVVAYGSTRWGRVPTIWASGVSIPVGAAIAVGFAYSHDSSFTRALELALPLMRASRLGAITGVVLAVAVLAGPWTAGLLVRVNASYRQSAIDRRIAQAQAAAAGELAAVRAEQARLARDVHDVVGHSLAVIIAQADSAQLRPASDVDSVRQALANIAGVARSSLGEVRGVLSRTSDSSGSATEEQTDLDLLVDGVRAAGNDVLDSRDGTPGPMDGPNRIAAYRALQEMMTNALKHGVPGAPIEVDRRWTPSDLTIRVRNVMGPGPAPGGGSGLEGMRDRVESVGGRVLAGRSADDAASFEVVVSLPLSARAVGTTR